MDYRFDIRPAESPLVDYVWQTRSENPVSFISSANAHWEIVFTTHRGKTTVTARGPETIATPADGPPDAEYFGIVFKLGAFMPHLLAKEMKDRKDVNLPVADDTEFWLHGAVWEIPTFENADTFINRLVRQAMLVNEPLVDATLQGHVPDVSVRSVQRRFVQATGLTYGTVVQIERAQQAATALSQGISIADVVFQAGYYDQPHLTRSLKRFAGQTPAQIASTPASE